MLIIGPFFSVLPTGPKPHRNPLQGQYLARTGIPANGNRWEKVHRENPVFITGMGLQCSPNFNFCSINLITAWLMYNDFGMPKLDFKSWGDFNVQLLTINHLKLPVISRHCMIFLCKISYRGDGRFENLVGQVLNQNFLFCFCSWKNQGSYLSNANCYCANSSKF